MIKNILKKVLPNIYYIMLRDRKEYLVWMLKGSMNPPPHFVKQKTIQKYSKKYGCKTLIETGTYYGDMVAAQRQYFDKIVSIELSQELYELCKERFKNDQGVLLYQGDSSNVLPKIIDSIGASAVFWLDGHYSSGITAKGEKECPIFEELHAIFSVRQDEHVVLIDDARCFIGEGDYPTIAGLTKYIKDADSEYQVEVKNDIIRVYKPQRS